MGTLVQLGGMTALTAGVWKLAGWGWALVVVGICLIVLGIAVEVERTEQVGEEQESEDAGQAAAA